MNHLGHFSADGIAKTNVGNNAVAEESIDTMASAIEKLVGDYEVERLVLLLQRTNS